MNAYKGFVYPTVREFYQDEEKYTNPKDENQWIYNLGGVDILIDKDKGNKEVDEIFKHFVDQVFEDTKKISNAVNDMARHAKMKNAQAVDNIVQKKAQERLAEIGMSMEKFQEAQNPDNDLSEEEVNKIKATFNGEELPEEEPEEVEEEKSIEDTVNEDEGLVDNETFDEMVARINNQEINFGSDDPIKEEEIMDYLTGEHPEATLMLNEVIDKNFPISKDSIKALLKVANRRMKKEEFNVYKEFPEEVKEMINKYVTAAIGVPNNYSMEVNNMRNRVSESLIDDFISNIQMDRMQSDFGKQVQDIFSKGASEVSEMIVGYSREKIESYHKSLEKIEDPEKKERLTNILANIEDAHDLSSLKEFSKKCKIKSIDLEKPKRIFDTFTFKYNNSTYDAFSIDMIKRALINRLEGEGYTEKDINAFFIAFCKQVTNYKSDNILHHSYMYFVTYNCALLEINVSDNTKGESDEFVENVKEVIANLKNRNKGVL